MGRSVGARAAAFAVMALLVGAGSACATGGGGHSSTSPTPVKVYDSNLSPLPGNVHSQGFECCEVNEFGDEVQLAGTARKLRSATVTMSIWSLLSDYQSYGYHDPSGWDQALTLNLYNVSADNTQIGTKIKSVQTVVHLPWRPETGGCVDATAWKAGDGVCYHGLAHEVTFDLSHQNITVPNKFVWTISFNTSSYGANPIGAHGPYDSLNVGAQGNGATTGTDVQPDKAWLSSPANAPDLGYPFCDHGAAGVSLRPDGFCLFGPDQESHWTGWTPEISFSAV